MRATRSARVAGAEPLTVITQRAASVIVRMRCIVISSNRSARASPGPPTTMKPAMTAAAATIAPVTPSAGPRSRLLVMLVALLGVADEIEEDAAGEDRDHDQLEQQACRQ